MLLSHFGQNFVHGDLLFNKVMVNCGQDLDLGLFLALFTSLPPSFAHLILWIFGSRFTFPIHLFRIWVDHSPLLNVFVCAYYHMAQIFASPSLRAFHMQWLTSHVEQRHIWKCWENKKKNRIGAAVVAVISSYFFFMSPLPPPICDSLVCACDTTTRLFKPLPSNYFRQFTHHWMPAN